MNVKVVLALLMPIVFADVNQTRRHRGINCKCLDLRLMSFFILIFSLQSVFVIQFGESREH